MLKKEIINNNLRFLATPIPGAQSVTVAFFVKTGSRNETTENNGISHFLEHMFFKGTLKRPSSQDIMKLMDSIGAEFNAFTSKDHTVYFIKTVDEHLELAIDVLSDILLNSKFEAKEIKKESGVIAEEINVYEDTPMRGSYELFENALFNGHALGMRILGTKSTVASFSRKIFVDYVKKYYFPQNMVVSVAGKFDQENAKILLEKYFIKEYVGREIEFTDFIETQKEPKVNLKTKKTEQTHLVLGVRAYKLSNPKKYALQIIDTILGASMSSRITEEIREKRGLAYYVHSYCESFTDCGYFAVRAGVTNAKTKEAITVILNEFSKIKKEGIKPDEFDRAKEQIKGKASLQLEASDDVAIFYGLKELLLGKTETIEQYKAKIDAVKMEEVQEVLDEIFVKEKLNLAIIGPQKNENEFKKLLKF